MGDIVETHLKAKTFGSTPRSSKTRKARVHT